MHPEQKTERYKYHLELFLHFNNRRCMSDWKDEEEEALVKELDTKHARAAARFMPDELWTGAFQMNG